MADSSPFGDFAGIPGSAWQGFWGGLGFGTKSEANSTPSPGNPDPLSFGQADISTGSPAMMGGNQPVFDPNSGLSNAGATSPTTLPSLVRSSSDPTGPMGGGGQALDQNQEILQKFLGMMTQPALDLNKVSGAFANVGPVPDYLGLTQQNYRNAVGNIQNMQNQMNDRYSQVGTDLNDLYSQDSKAAMLGGNNVLTAIAGNQGQAIQNNAANAANTLANLKNSQLAARAAIAQKAGMSPTQAPSGDAWRVDPNEVAVQGIVQNAQQAANNANSAAADRTLLNNDMATALKGQGDVMQQQLQNEKLGYNASVGKYLADLANQESTREMQAAEQSYQNKLGLAQGIAGLYEKAAELQNAQNAGFLGNKGFPSIFSDLGIGDLDKAKSIQAIAQATGGTPYNSAVNNSNPQIAGLYNNALASMQGKVQPGTKATWQDIAGEMARQNGGQMTPDIINFAQAADASKPTGGLSSVDDLMNMIYQSQ